METIKRFTALSKKINFNMLCFYVCVLFNLQVYAQDKITLKDGSEIEGKVTEINETHIKYVLAGQNQPVQLLPKWNVFMIAYLNGTREVFTEPAVKPEFQTASINDNRYDPDTSDFAKIRQKKFSGPRVGFTFLGNGTSAAYLENKNKRENFVQFGWQFETVLFTAGSTSGLLEFVPLIGGFEQGLFIPSVNVLLGIRSGEKQIFEFALGPNFAIGRDYLGNAQANVGLVLALGTSFRKDKINFPLTFAFVPSVGSKQDVYDPNTAKTHSENFETGWKFSVLVGFNTRKH